METRVTAVVRVEVTIPSGSVWGRDTTVEQVRKQALDGFENAVGKINSPCVQNGVNRGSVGMRIVGKPRVEMVVMEAGTSNEIGDKP